VSERRFERQVRFAPLGAAGQARLEASSVLVVGCGALGGALAQSLVRSGVGRVRVVDRDIVEETNLPRQVLFEPAHLGRPKVEAALETLARIGGPSVVDGRALHVDTDTLPELARDVELVLDGTDNLSTRYLINDYAVERGIPWVYGGVVGGAGLVLPVLPGVGACLRCIFPEPAPPGALPTCDTAGVLQPAVAAIAALQAACALRLLSTPREERDRVPLRLVELDVWNLESHSLSAARDPDCPCCARREFPWLDAPAGAGAVSLCGRNTVQVRPQLAARPDLAEIARRLDGVVDELALHGGLLVFRSDGVRFTVFPDGRALLEGTSEIERARALYDRVLGS
jgi:adenylyltransferase/sulfurtransferase